MTASRERLCVVGAMALAGMGVLSAQNRPVAIGQDSGAGLRVFTGARVIDGTGAVPIDDAVIVVRDGRVVAVGPAASTPVPEAALQQRMEAAGKIIVPGFISAHAHVSDVDGVAPRAYTTANTLRQLRLFARYGVTTVWSLGGEQQPGFDARDSQATPALDRARLFLAGDIVTAATPEAARAAVARVVATRPDVIKIRVDDNLGTSRKMPPAVYRAVIEEAHRHGVRVAAHVFYLEDAKDLLRAGVDVIAHSVRDVEIDDEFVALMRARNVPYCPTLTRELSTFVYASRPAWFDDPFFTREADPAVVARLLEPARQAAMRSSETARRYRAALDVASRNLARAAAAGLHVVMGTDSGAFAERFEGWFEHLEMQMMVEAGLTPAQVLHASTGAAARAMGLKDVGTLTPGAWADLVILDRDPIADVRQTRSISSVWIAGNRVPAR